MAGRGRPFPRGKSGNPAGRRSGAKDRMPPPGSSAAILFRHALASVVEVDPAPLTQAIAQGPRRPPPGSRLPRTRCKAERRDRPRGAQQAEPAGCHSRWGYREDDRRVPGGRREGHRAAQGCSLGAGFKRVIRVASLIALGLRPLLETHPCQTAVEITYQILRSPPPSPPSAPPRLL